MALKTHFFSPSRTIFISIIAAIIIGTFLLSLPIAQTRPLPLIDVFFTATSATTVTGLLTVPIDSFTYFGLGVIMFLIQIGGLGLITLTLFVVSLFTNLGLGTQVMAGEMLELESWKDTRKILFFIIMLTFTIEAIGALFIFQTLRNDFSLFDSIFYSIFHSISAFCNSGMTPFKEGMILFTHSYNILIVTAFLMIAGGIGFITWRELINRWNPFIKNNRNYSLQTRIILYYYFSLVSINTLMFWLLEHKNTFEAMSFPLQIIESFFVSVTVRSGGYLPVYPNDMQHASLFYIMVNAFIGSAPGSTGSGVKITTMAIFIATINAAVFNQSSVDLRGRRIMKDQVYRALAIVALSIAWIATTTFCLLITEKSWNFLDIAFETVSAFSTLGASLGMTPYLSIVGKIFITLTMFIGRIGSLTLMIALRPHIDKSGFAYPEERVMIT
ncbi:MAG: trk system potassium uptake protein TrkH [Alteromonas naphthalenivorans]|jgi:trk system potassium uptake protein TrkH